MANRKLHYSKEDVLNAIRGSGGFISTVAKRLNCDWHTAHKYIHKYKDTQYAFYDEQEIALDVVEGKAFQAAGNGDGAMIRFILSTKGKRRGYSYDLQLQDKPDNMQDNDIRIIIDDSTQQ